jgi:hypothetical protein
LQEVCTPLRNRPAGDYAVGEFKIIFLQKMSKDKQENIVEDICFQANLTADYSEQKETS